MLDSLIFNYQNMGILKEISINNRKKYFKYIFTIFILLGLFWYFYFQKNTTQEVLNLVKVEKRDIVSSFSNDGKVYYKEIYDLNFLSNGVLKSIYKKEGDNVISGELIAQLDDKYLKIDLDKAKIALKTAQANLEAKLATKGQQTDVNISQKQLELSQNTLQTNYLDAKINLDNAKTNVENIKTDLDNTKISTQIDIDNALKTLNLKQNDLENAKTNLTDTQKLQNLNIQNNIEKLHQQIISSLSLFESYLNDEDTILGISLKNKNFNNDFEIYLGAKNSQTKTLAEKNYAISFDSFTNLNNNLQNFNSFNYIDYQTNFLNTYQTLITSLNSTLDMLKNSVSSYNFSQAIIDSYISNIENDINLTNLEYQKILSLNQSISTSILDQQNTISTLNNSISSLSLQVDHANTNLEKIKTQSKSALDDLTQKLKLANDNLDQAQIKLQNNLLLSNSQVDISKANLENKVSSFDERELSPFYTQIENAKKGLEEAQKKLDDSKLYSPINGVLAKLNIDKIGSLVNQNSQTPFAVVVNKNSIYVESKVEQADIKNVFLNQKVKINFNSLNDFSIDGKVVFISDKSDTDANGIVSYKVLIDFDNFSEKIKEGFSVQAFFTLKQEKKSYLCLLKLFQR